MWNGSSVVVTINNHVSLAGFRLDFIELDGSIDTSPEVSDAIINQSAVTLTWSAPARPWQDGDLLMLRIRNSSTTPSLPPSATPTAARQPTLTATPGGSCATTGTRLAT